MKKFLQVVNNKSRYSKYIHINGPFRIFTIDRNRRPLGGITIDSVFSDNYDRDFDFNFTSLIHYYETLFDVYRFFKGQEGEDATYYEFFRQLKDNRGNKVWGNGENVVYRYFYADYYEDVAQKNIIYLGHRDQLGDCQAEGSYAYHRHPRFDMVMIMNMAGDACIEKLVSPFETSSQRRYIQDIKNYITNTGFSVYLLKHTAGDDNKRATLIFVSDGTFTIDDNERTIVMAMDECAQNGYLDDMLSSAMPYDEARRILKNNKCHIRPLKKA